MNSRTRVRTALAHEEPDRPPIGFFAIDYDTVERVLGRPTYVRAKAKCQIAFWEGRRDEVVQSWIEDTIDLHRKLDVIDVLRIASPSIGFAPPRGYQPDPPRRIDETTWEDRRGRVFKLSEVTGDITCVHDPEQWTRVYREEDFDPEAPVTPPDPSCFEAIDAVIAALADDFVILGPEGGEAAWVLLGGMERGLYEFAANPQVVKRAIRCAVNRANQLDEHTIRPGQDGVMWGTDFADKNGPLISPAMFRAFCLPGLIERTRRLHERGQVVFKHACGNNWKLLDMFCEAGFDGYQSIQESAGMDLAEVKRRYGDRLTLWGGVQVEHLVSGTTDDVRHDVRRALQTAASGGGFILGTTHSVAVGTKYDNFMAMLDEFARLTA